MSEPLSRLLPALSLTGGVFIWASSFPAAKVILTAFDPMVMVFARMAIACCCIAPFWHRLRGQPFRRSDWKYLLFMALCEPCLYFLFEAHALVHTSASQAGMIAALLPLMVTAGAFMFLGERVTARTMAGFAMAISGAAWLSLAGEATDQAPNPLLGNILEFLAMAMASGYMVTLRHLTRSYSPHFLTCFQAVMGFVFFLPMLALPSTQLPTQFPLLPTLGLVYMGTFVTLGAYGMYNYGASKLPASQASVFINLIPVFAVALGWTLLGERLNAQQIAASVLVLAGVFMSQQRRRRRKRENKAQTAPSAEG